MCWHDDQIQMTPSYGRFESRMGLLDAKMIEGVRVVAGLRDSGLVFVTSPSRFPFWGGKTLFAVVSYLK